LIQIRENIHNPLSVEDKNGRDYSKNTKKQKKIIRLILLHMLFHLVTCTRYFKKELEMRDKLIRISLPLVVNIVYIFDLLYPVSILGSIPEALSEQVTIGGETFKPVPAGTVPGSYEQITVDGVTYDLVPTEPIAEQPTDSSLDLVPIVISNFIVGGLVEHDATFWPPFFAGYFTT
jgi:hypothetical protein